MKKRVTLEHRLATDTASMIRYIGLDVPSNTYYHSMDNILNCLLCQKTASRLRKKFDKMTYREVVTIERKVNKLLESGKYD